MTPDAALRLQAAYVAARRGWVADPENQLHPYPTRTPITDDEAD